MANTLYTVPTANGQRASIALEECNIAYDVRTVDLFSGEHRSDEMLALNPVGRMPFIAVEGRQRPIYGSLAIGTWAAAQAGQLIPAGDAAIDYHHWMGIVMTDIAPACAAQFYLEVLATEPQTWGVNWCIDTLTHLLSVVDRQLADHEYLAGGAYSLVDVMFFPVAATSRARIRDRIPKMPNIDRWQATVAARGAVQRGMAVSR